MKTVLRTAAILLAYTCSSLFAAARAQDAPPAEFQSRTYRNAAGASMPYRLFVPPSYDAKRKFPIVLWLHGAACRGNDILLQISAGNTLGAHVWTKPENQAKLPAFVLAPQLLLALEILDAVGKEYSIDLDLDRVYVAGQSMGGEGSWVALIHAPGRFAAAVRLCGCERRSTRSAYAGVDLSRRGRRSGLRRVG